MIYYVQETSMETKLTLSVDDEIIRRAKEYARQHRVSLSDLVERYFESLVRRSEEVRESGDSTPLTDGLSGALKGMGFSTGDARVEYLSKKYLHE